MGAFKGKYVIGLTGNIATGKSEVRKMLQQLGAMGIDADYLAHRAIAKGAPGYQPVVDLFGRWILDVKGEIDRKKLAQIVFSDPKALTALEAIVHPLVMQAAKYLIQKSTKPIVVVEAIKLLESDMDKMVDAVWVVTAPEEVQLERLLKKGYSREEALQRLRAQSPQEEKIKRADVVIVNDGPLENTWRQVQKAWENIPLVKKQTSLSQKQTPASTADEEVFIYKAGPKDAAKIADFIAQVTRNRINPSRAEVLMSFGKRAYMIVERKGQVIGLVGYHIEDLVLRVPEFFVRPEALEPSILKRLLQHLLKNARELLCEAALIFLHPNLYKATATFWAHEKFTPTTIEGLKFRAWMEAARESQPKGTIILFRQLRQKRVTKPDELDRMVS